MEKVWGITELANVVLISSIKAISNLFKHFAISKNFENILGLPLRLVHSKVHFDIHRFLHTLK